MTTVIRPAIASEIVTICGHLDDDVIAEIAATGATAAEVLEASTWYSADDQIGNGFQRGAVGAVYEILIRADPDRDKRR